LWRVVAQQPVALALLVQVVLVVREVLLGRPGLVLQAL